MRCAVLIDDASGRQAPVDRERIQAVVDAACGEAKRDECSLTVRLVSAEESAELHKTHFREPDATDVMTFPDESLDRETGRTHLGDLAVCPDIAAARGTNERDEITLYVLHGLLHLLGYDDTTPEKAREMWAAQKRLLKTVGVEVAED